MKRLKHFIFFWLPVFLWMGVIFYLSSQTTTPVSSEWGVNFSFYKTLHLLEYAGLYLLIFRALKFTSSLEDKWITITTFIIVFFYASSDEFHQRFTAGRESAFRDVIIDCIGAVIAWIFLTYILPILPRKLRHWVESWQLF